MNIVEHRYGKSRVRLARIIREKDRHDFVEMTIAIQLEGDFAESYSEGDNSRVLPTDTMKNTVYALAKDPAVAQPESFGLLLARHFLEHNKPVTGVRIELFEHVWTRHGRHSFTAGGAHRRTAIVHMTREAAAVEAGVAGYVLLKTTGSEFKGYLKDRYTTLEETSDRILSTSLDAAWRYRGEDVPWSTSWHGVMKLITDTFAEHESKSVQHTLHDIGETVLQECEFIDRIKLTMPNKHYLPVNLKPFGLENGGEIFVPTDEPHGLIEAVLSR